MTVLSIHDLVKTFGGLTAVDDVSLGVEEGEIRALIGPNGAGKTTLFNCVTGTLAPDCGRVEVRGAAVTGLPPDALVTHGIARTFQVTSLFPELSVWDNLAMSVSARLGCPASLSFRRRRSPDVCDRVESALDRVGFTGDLHAIADTLPHGRQRIVELAAAIALEPRILFLDEPAAGLAGADRTRLMDLILDLRDQSGLTVVLVEHDMDIVMKVCDRITVLREGAILSEGAPKDVASDVKVREAYLGTEG